jgi:hypothetical protein
MEEGVRRFFAKAEKKTGMQGAASPLLGGMGAVPPISLPRRRRRRARMGTRPCKEMTDMEEKRCTICKMHDTIKATKKRGL